MITFPPWTKLFFIIVKTEAWTSHVKKLFLFLFELGCERYDGGFSCLPCSSLCKNSACDISTTKCLHCYEGYRGTDCTQGNAIRTCLEKHL